VSPKNRHRLATLDKQRFVILQRSQTFQDCVKRFPIAGRTAAAAIDK
jgi:hypothetical protein